MKLENKKALIARTLNVGKSRVVLNLSRLAELKEAITKQDVKDLLSDGAITVKEIRGRKKVVKRKTRRRAGSIKQKVNKRKQTYVKLTRKLRTHLKILKDQEKISKDSVRDLRKQIRASEFRSLAHLKERIKEQDLFIKEAKK
jgi:large subunit ribosomal protein L19e